MNSKPSDSPFDLESLEPRIMLSGEGELLTGIPPGSGAEVVLAMESEGTADESLPPISAGYAFSGLMEPVLASATSVLEWSDNVGANGNILINQSLEINGEVFAVSGAKSVDVDSASGLLVGQTVFQGGDLASATGLGLVHQIAGNRVYLRDVTGTFADGQLLRADGSAYQSQVTTATMNTAGSLLLGASGSGNVLDARNGRSDTLTLKANGGSVTVNAAVGQFNRLGEFRVADAVNVTFNQPVRVEGDLVIYASGDVNFNANVDVTGSILIHGTNRIFFGNSIEVKAGAEEIIFLQTDTLNLPQNRTNSVISPGGTLVIEATTLTRDIHVASPETNQFNILDITLTELAAIRADLGRFVIGREVNGLARAGAGDVLIGAAAQSESFTFRHDTEIYGNNIRVSDYLNTQRQLWASQNLSLIAEHNILIENTLMVDVWNAANPSLTLIAEKGSVAQQNSANVPVQEVIRVRNLHVRSATGTELLWTEVNELNVLNTGPGGEIRIHTQASDPVFGISGDLLLRRAEQSHAAGSGGIVISTQLGDLTLGTTGAAYILRGTTRGADQRVLSLNAHTVLAAGAGMTTAGSGDLVLVTATNARLSGQNPADTAFKLVGDGHTILVQNLVQGVNGTLHLLSDGQVRNTGVLRMTAAGLVRVESRAGQILQDADMESAGGTLTLTAHTAVTMANGVRTHAGTGGIFFSAGTNITLSELIAENEIVLSAQTGWIRRAAGFAAPHNLDGETQTVSLQAAAGLGEAASPLLTRMAGLTAVNTLSGGLYLRESTSLAVLADGISLGGSSGSAVIRVESGGLNVNGAMTLTGASGNLRLDVANTTSLSAEIRSENGSISLLSGGNLNLNAAGRMVVAGAGQTVDLLADTGSLFMHADARVETNGGNVRIGVAGGMTLAAMDARTLADRAAPSRDEQAGWGAVQLDAQSGAVIAAVSGTLLWASDLRIAAGLQLGSAASPLRTDVIRLAALAGEGPVFVSDAGDLTVAEVADVMVNRVNLLGAQTAEPGVPGAPLTGVAAASGQGAVVLEAAGTLRIDEAVSGVGTGNLFLGAGADLILNAEVNADGGHVGVLAGETLSFNVAGRLLTSGAGTVDVRAGAVEMAAGARIESGSGNLRLDVEGGLLISLLSTAGHISLLADSVQSTGSGPQLVGDHLRLDVAGAAGDSEQTLRTNVNRLSARTGGLYLENLHALRIDETAVIVVNRVNPGDPATPAAVSDAEMRDLVATGAGRLFVGAMGTLTMVDGTRAQSGAGDVFLFAAEDLLLAEVISASGDVTLVSDTGAIRDNTAAETPNVITPGWLLLVAAEGIGDVDAADLNTRVGTLTAVNHQSGRIVIRQETDLRIAESVFPGLAGVGIQNHAPEDSVLLQVQDGTLTVDAPVDAAAGGNLLLQVLGEEKNLIVNAPVATADGPVMLFAGTGSLLVNARVEAGGQGTLALGADLGVVMTQAGQAVTAGGNVFVTSVFDVQLHGVNAGSGQVQVTAEQGAISRTGGSGADVTAADLRLDAQGRIGTLFTDVNRLAAVSADGSLDVRNAGSVLIEPFGSVSVVYVLFDDSLESMELPDNANFLIAAGDVRLESENGDMVMAEGSRAESAAGDITLNAAGDVVITLLDAQDGGTVTVTAGDRIVDGSADETPNLLTSGAAVLSAVNGIGDFGAADLNLRVGSVQAANTAGGRIVLREEDGLVVNGLSGPGDIVLTVDEGALMVNGDVSAHGAGSVRLHAVAGAMSLNADVHSAEGLLTLEAAGDVSVDAHLEAASDLSIRSGGSVTMDSEAEMSAANLRVDVAENLTLSLLQAQAVSLLAGGWIRRAAGSGTGVNAEMLRMTAGTGIGLALDKLSLDVRTLAAFSAENGMHFDTVGALTVGTVSVTTEGFLPSGLTEVGVDAGLSGLGTDERGNILLLGTGDLTLAEGVLAEGDGRILLSTAGSITVDERITSAAGPVTVRSGTALQIHADIFSEADLWLDADGALTLLGTVTVAGANVRLSSGGDLTVGRVNGDAVSLVAGGAVLKAVDSGVNVAADHLRIDSEGDVGTGPVPLRLFVAELSARSAIGGIFLRETNGLTVTSVEVTTEIVLADATTERITDAAQADLTAATHVVLGVEQGDLILNDGDSNGQAMVAEGNIRLDAETGAITLNASVESGGHVTLLAQGAVAQAAAGHLRATGSGTLDVEAASITMADGAEATSVSGNIRYAAAGQISVGYIGTDGHVSLLAGGVFDSGSAGNTDSDVIASTLRIHSAGAVGESNTPLTTAVTRLSARAGAAGLFMIERTGLLVGRTAGITVSRVSSDGQDFSEVSDGQQDDLVSEGALVLVANAGGITAEATGAITAADNLLLQTEAADSDVTLGADVTSTGGHITLAVGHDLFQNANVTTHVSAGTIDVIAGGSITMQDGVITKSKDGNIRLAVTSGAANIITLSSIQAGTAAVSLHAGYILDGGDAQPDVVAAELRMQASRGIGFDGETVNAIDTDVGVLTAHANLHGVFVDDIGTLNVDRVEAVTVNVVGVEGLVSGTRTDTAQEDVVTASGGAVVLEADHLVVNRGNLTFAVNAGGSGNVRLQARNGNVEVNGQVNAGTGNLTVFASGDVVLAGLSQILTTAAAVTQSTVHVDAMGRIVMTSGASITTSGGAVRLRAETDVLLGLVNAGSGAVAVLSTQGEVLDNQTPAGKLNVEAGALLLQAAQGLGRADNALEFNVSILSAHAGAGGMYLLDSATVTVGEVSVKVETVATDALVSNVSQTLSGVRTLSGGALVLRATINLTLNDANNDGFAVQAEGSGNLLLAAVNGALTQNGTVDGGSGSVSLRAGTALNLNADVFTSGSGTLELISETAGLSMAETMTARTDGGNAHLQANFLLTLSRVDVRTAADRLADTRNEQAVWGQVSLVSATSEIQVRTAVLRHVEAASLGMAAGAAVAAVAAPVRTEVLCLAAQSGNGGVFVQDESGLEVGTVDPVAIQRVGVDGTAAAQSGGVLLFGLRTLAGNGHIIVTAVEDLSVTQVVSALGAGGVFLGAGGSMEIAAAISSVTGNLHLQAQTNLAMLSGASVQTADPGHAVLEAVNGDLVMAGEVVVSATDAVARLRAGGGIWLGRVEAQQVSLITGQHALFRAAYSPVNVAAQSLRIFASASAGLANDPLQIQVSKLAAHALAGDLFLLESDAVTVDAVSVTANAFGADGLTTLREDAAIAGLQTLGGGQVVLCNLTGNLTLMQTAQSHGHGNILLHAKAGSLTLEADVVSESGRLTLKAESDVNLNADLEADADISVDAETGNLTFAVNAVAKANEDASVRLRAGVNLILGQVNANAVSLIAGGDLTRAVGSPVNVQADQLHIRVQGGVATSAEKLLMDVNVLSARAVTGNLFIHNLSALTVGTVTVTVSEFTATAGFESITDTAQSGLTAEAGNVVLFSDDSVSLGLVKGGTVTLLVSGDVIHLTGSGTNVISDSLRIAASGDIGSGTETLEIEAGTLAATAENMYIQALGDLLLGVVTDTEGSDNGLLANGDIVLTATGDLSMGPVTGPTVNLSSGGDILNVTGTLLNISAEDLTLTAEGNIGALDDPIQIDAGTVRSQSVTGSIHLAAAGGLLVDSLAAANDIILNVEVALGSAPGAGTNLTADRVRITAGSDIGPLTADINTLAARSNNGSFELANAGSLTLGTIEVLHGVTAETGVILTTLSGRILDGGDLNDDVISNIGPVTLTGADGLGTVGAGALEIYTPFLAVSTLNGGSVYLNLTRTTEVQGISLGGQGHLYLNVAGDQIQSGAVLVPQGSAFITVSGSYQGSAPLETSRELRLTATDADLDATAVLRSTTGDIQLRVTDDLIMAAGSHVHAVQGILRIVTGGDLVAAILEASRILDLRAGGDLSAVSTDRTMHELRASALRLLVQGTVEPILTRTERLDVRAGGVQEIFEYDSLTAGRFGFRLEDPAAKDEFVLRMGDGVLDSMREDIQVDGDVVFVLLSDDNATVTLATPIVLPEGDIRVEVDGMALDPALSGVMLSAATGDVILNVGGGVGTIAQRIVVDAETFTALAQSGQLVVRFATPVTIGADGVEIQTGGNEIDLLVDGGSLTLDGSVRHQGTGAVQVNTPNGGITVPVAGSTAKISTGGRITLNLSTGVTVAGGNRLNLSSGSLSAVTQTGNLRLNVLTGTQIAAGGIEIESGSGVLDLHVANGNLTMDSGAMIRNGTGNLTLNVVNGAFTMLANNELLTHGIMDIQVRNTFTVGRLTSRGSATTLMSLTGSILRAQGSTGANLELLSYRNHGPVITFADTSNIRLAVDLAIVNDVTRSRSGTQTFLELP